MSATGLDVFDKTVQTTNAWLKEIMEVTGPDRRRAYRVLAAVLHALRDRLAVDEAAQPAACASSTTRSSDAFAYRNTSSMRWPHASSRSWRAASASTAAVVLHPTFVIGL